MAGLFHDYYFLGKLLSIELYHVCGAAWFVGQETMVRSMAFWYIVSDSTIDIYLFIDSSSPKNLFG